jgi:erythromycin esterase-like protein
VRQLPSEPAHERPFKRFPTWMSRNLEVKHFIDYLRIHNDARSPITAEGCAPLQTN